MNISTENTVTSGAHDNGYISTLNHLQNEGHLHKIIVLRGYKELASELKNLQLPSLEIDGLFLKKRLQSMNKGLSSKKSPAIIQAQDFEKFRTKGAPSLPATRGNSSLEKGRDLLPDVVGILELLPHTSSY